MAANNFSIWKRIIFLVFILITNTLLCFVFARYIFPIEIVEKTIFGFSKRIFYDLNKKLFIILLSATYIFTILAWYINFYTDLFIRFRLYFQSRSIVIKKIIAFIFTVIAFGAFITGLVTPLYYSEKFFLYKNEVTLLDSIKFLHSNHEIYLALLVGIFTLLFPIVKFLMIFTLLIFSESIIISNLRKWIEKLSKWSMLDVFIVAILLLNMKLDSSLLNMELRQGIIWFSVSILLIIIVFSIIPNEAKKNNLI